MSGFDDYAKYDGLGLAELVRKTEVQPRELVDEAIRRIEQLNPQVNAVIQKTYDFAREAADGDLPDGPFKGVPFLLKDLVVTLAGVPMRSGCRFPALSPVEGGSHGGVGRCCEGSANYRPREPISPPHLEPALIATPETTVPPVRVA